MAKKNDGECVWFKHGTALILMIEIMTTMTEEMTKTKYCVKGERVRGKSGNGPPEETIGTNSCDVPQNLQISRSGTARTEAAGSRMHTGGRRSLK